jgi:hypothetical protein
VSNVSDLFPAGGGNNTIDMVASGALSNGDKVILQSDGTVKVVGLDSISLALPAASSVQYYSASTGRSFIQTNPYNTSQFVVAYTLGSNDYAYCVVGTVTGTVISFNTPTAFSTVASTITGLTFDKKTSGSFVVAFHTSSTEYGTVIVGNISGSSLTFGTPVVYYSGEATLVAVAFDPTAAGVFVITFRAGSYSINSGIAIVGTVSSTTVSFGSGTTVNGGRTTVYDIQFDPNQTGTFIITYGDNSSSNYGTLIAGTRSGNSLSFGSEYRLDNRYATGIFLSFDPHTSGRFMVGFTDSGSSNKGVTMVGTISGNSISLGSAQVFNTSNTDHVNPVWDTSTANAFILIYRNYGNNGYGTVIQGTVSSTTATFGTNTVYVSVSTSWPTPIDIGSNIGKIVVTYKDITNSGAGTAILLQLPAQITNLTSTNLLGIAQATVADTETLKVETLGGLSTNLSGLTIGSKYYVQDDGTTTTSSSGQFLGRAVTATTINMKDFT